MGSFSSVDKGADVRILAVGASYSLAGKVLGRAMQICEQVLLARVLGPSIFGVYGIGWTFYRIGSVIAPLGLENGVVRFGTQTGTREGTRKLICDATLLAASFGLAMGVVLYLSAPWLAHYVFNEPRLTGTLKLFSVALPATGAFKVVASATRLKQSTRRFIQATEIVFPLARMAFVVVAVLLGWALGGAVAAVTASSLVALAFAWRYVESALPDDGTVETTGLVSRRQVLAFSIPTTLATTFGMLVPWVDRLMIGWLRPAAEVGIYLAVSQLATIFAIISSAFNSIFAPMIAKCFADRDRDRAAILYQTATRWGLFVCTPIVIVFLLFRQGIIEGLYGEAYAAGVIVFGILTVGQFTMFASGPVGLLLIMAGYQKWTFYATVSMFMSNIILNFLLIPKYGMVGAAVATAMSSGGMYLLRVSFAWNRLRILPYNGQILKVVAAGLVATIAGWLFHVGEFGMTTLVVVLGALLVPAVFALVVFAIGLDLDDRMALNLIRRKIGVAFGVGHR